MLAGVLGGIGAWAASSIGRAGPVGAANGDPVLAGQGNTATAETSITNSAGGDAFTGFASGSGTGVTGASSSGIGLHGTNTSTASQPAVLGATFGATGVEGRSGIGGPTTPALTGVLGWAGHDATAVGVHGESVDGLGVLGLATGSGTSAIGLFARSNSTNAPAIGARSAGNSTGLIAKSGGGSFPAAKARTGIYGYAAQSSGSKGVWGNSPAGHGLHGESSSGWAGYFDGRLFVKRYVEMVEVGTPSAPGGNHARLFIQDNGNGKTQLCVRFHTGSVKVLAIQP
jgi:hypothetical protein